MTPEKTASGDPYNISEDELLAIGLTLNDGMERGWLRTLAMLLKKNPSVVSKWKKEIHRVSQDDVQHMRLLVLLKEAGVLQASLIAARSAVPLSDIGYGAGQGASVRKSAREEISQALARGK
jgi:hypothetical protein